MPDEEVGTGASRELLLSVARRHRQVLVLEPSDDGAAKVARKGTGTFEVTFTAPDAAPTAAYCERSSPEAFSDHGISSASSRSQSVSNSAHRPASSTAARTRPRISSVTESSSKNGRPVRV